MKFLNPGVAVGMIVLLSSALTPITAHATDDSKSISPLRCQALGPNTTISELTINANGITNPGVTNESVICEIPKDAETQWSTTAGADAHLTIYYRAGSVSGKVTCTAYVGSSGMDSTAVYTASGNPPAVTPGVRGDFDINLAYSPGVGFWEIPVNLLCTITPKAQLAAIYFQETSTTNTP